MSASLSEQMGAMALVDQLRHREMEIQEHLDLPRRRAEVAERIRTYYQNNSIAFDDALIDEGVRQFFSRRLMFEAPPLSRRQRLLAHLCLKRDQWVRFGAAMAFPLLLIVLGVWYVQLASHEGAERLVSNSRSVQSEIAVQRQRLEQARQRLQREPNAIVAGVLDNAERLLPQAQPPLELDPKAFADKEAYQAQAAKAATELAVASKNLASARQLLDRLDPLYASLAKHKQLLARLQAMPLPAADRQQLSNWANTANKDLAGLRLESADSTLAMLETYLDFAAEPLTLELVDRPGIKSGVERCYEPSGCSPNSARGKSWYLIVEALDGAGQPAQVPVTSVESQQTRWAQRFGVRVSQEQYLRVRQDKLEDGHISQRLVGNKAANSLTLRFDPRVGRSPDMILEW